MKKILIMMIGLSIALTSCMSKEEKEKQAKEKAKIEREQFYNDSIIADNERKKAEEKRIEELRQDSIHKAESAQTMKELKPYFTFKKDEFSDNNTEWVMPKDAPKYINHNGIYCYFQSNDGRASNFRLKIQYAADDWLFIRYYIFSIDGMVFEYRPDNIETDNDSSIWEWADNQITAIDNSLINTLADAKSAKIKFEGRQYNKVKNITSAQLKSIQRTLKLYRAMGGSL